KVVRVKSLIANEFKNRSMKLLTATAGDYVYLPAATASRFGGEQAALHFELSDRIKTGVRLNRDVRSTVGNVSAVDGVGVLRAARTVHRDVHRVRLAGGVCRSDVNLIGEVIGNPGRESN